MTGALTLTLLCAILAGCQTVTSAVTVGTPCSNHKFCNFDGPSPMDHSKCDDSKTCQCIPSYYGETNDTSCEQALLEDDCTTKVDGDKFCGTASDNAVCRGVEGNKTCVCAPGYHELLSKVTGTMVCTEIIIGTTCDPSTPAGDVFCQASIINSVCQSLGKVCRCAKGQAYVPATGQCEDELFVPSCAKCRKTGGYCYDTNDDGNPEGCACPAPMTSSGINASDTLNVGCDGGVAEIGDYCDDSVVCKDVHSLCAHSGDLTQRAECACKPGFVPVPAKDIDGYHCYSSIMEQTDPNCLHCVQEGGHCYDIDGDKILDGCDCPDSRTTSDRHDPTTDCDTKHVAVTCETSTMRVCYTPHNTTRFSNMSPRLDTSDSFVYVQNHFGQDPCILEKQPNGDWCVDLGLETEKTAACTTSVNYPERNIITYQNWFVLQLSRKGQGKSDVTFHTYCQYDTAVHAFTGNGAEVVGFESMASEGEELHPELKMKVYDEFKRDATEVGIRLGQPAMLEILMTDDKGVYNSIRPRVCIATNNPELANPETSSIMLLFDGCPVEDSYLNLRNTFFHDPVNDMKSMTGLFPMFQFEDSNFVFFHCAVTVCRDKDNCQPIDCAADKRKRRSIEGVKLSELKYVHHIRVKRATTEGSSLESLASGAVEVVGSGEQGGGSFGGKGAAMPPGFLLLVIAGGAVLLIIVGVVLTVFSVKRRRTKKVSNYFVNYPERT